VRNGCFPLLRPDTCRSRLAIRVAENPEDEQRALHEAYESKQLRGNRLLMAKKLIDTRKRRGKSFGDERENAIPRDKGDKAITVQDVLKGLSARGGSKTPFNAQGRCGFQPFAVRDRGIAPIIAG
jgi:hypothetical protein